MEWMRHDPVTAPISAAGLVAGYAVAVLSGSRALGGVVLACFGLVCIAVWMRRDGARTAATLAMIGLFAFAVSHVVGLLVGAWPAVLISAAALGVASWRLSDSRRSVATTSADAVARPSS